MTTEIFDRGNDTVVKCADFSLMQTLDCGQAFRFEKSGDMWQGVVGNDLLTMSQNGDEITFYDINKSDFLDKYYRYFTLDIDYSVLKSEFSKDKILAEAIKTAGGIRMLRQDKWETICSFIISQNNNIPRIKGIISRLCENFGEKISGTDEYTFPSAEKIAKLTVDDLAPLRAGFRAKYIIDAAEKTASHEVNLSALENMPLDEAKTELMKIKGVGPKVADCALLFSCSHFDAFPMDVWMKRVMAVLYPDGLPKCAEKYRGIAQQYLFHYARTIKLSDDE